eukprot:CAMPEP_0197589936 /NCGR_PEP_ID=MMETSP1326-20131121/10704_1 /TAXON_ID=1155430 /ORGANISM="Genus nov. species nov., Strain RCC2288" /LENGTH=101 /DNA_ID=CAMNT_0043154921 /DNA_START=89 /DNA_END=390 /DNA_ORIENTATION=-
MSLISTGNQILSAAYPKNARAPPHAAAAVDTPTACRYTSALSKNAAVASATISASPSSPSPAVSPTSLMASYTSSMYSERNIRSRRRTGPPVPHSLPVAQL